MTGATAAADPSTDAAFLGVTRSLTGRFWRPRLTDDRTAQALAQRLRVPEVVGRVLAARGVPLSEAESFLKPSLRTALPDPSHLLDMDRAVERIATAIQSCEAVAVFGDYDVDGATSSALLKRFFDAVGGDLRIYIPDRRTEGYGPSGPALQRLAGEGVTLVITVDCGVMAFDALDSGKAAGLDIVVVDHHQAEPRLPTATAIVNPNRLDESTPHHNLAAVGLTFLLLVALNRHLRADGWYDAARPEPELLDMLDLVALGTVCDVVPLTGLNRVLVAQGLKVMARRGNLGLRTLADVAGVSERPGAFHLGYILGPRVNAGGRIGQANLGARLLTTTNADEALALADELDRLNRERQVIESAVLERAIAQAEAETAPDAPLVFVAGEDWHSGVVGIVASRLRERFHRPAFVLGLEGGEAKGSGRSVPGVDLGSAVTAAKQAGLLINGGGHAMAAGVTVEAAKLDALAAFLSDRLAPQLAAAPPANSIGVDGTVSVSGANRNLYDIVEAAGPYGAGHAEPRFVIPGADVVKADVVGEAHVRVILAGGDGGRLKGIAFRAADNALGQALMQSHGARLHIAGHLRADDWNGRRQAQLIIEDAAFVHQPSASLDYPRRTV